MKTSKYLTVPILVSVILAPMLTNAAIVHLSGDTVDFYYDNSQPGMMAYGTLSNIGDSIFSTPTDFLAESLNGGIDSFSALGTVQVVAKNGYQFNAVQVAQQGDYKLAGVGSLVDSVSNLVITNNSYGVTDISTTLVNSSNFNNADGQLHQWSSSAIIDLDMVSWQGTSSIDLSLDSALYASTSDPGEIAFIQNKFVGGGFVTIITTPVPVPAAIWLMGSGLFVLVGLSRKRKTA